MLTISRPQQDIVAWFRTSQPNNLTDVAATAYANAVRFFEQELTQDERKREWIRGQSSMRDVYQVVDQAKELYDGGSDSKRKARKWVNKFADSLTYYGGVLDVLVQFDPAHAGLVWGALKFVFSGVLNHAQLVSELSKALTKIGEVLPRAHVDATLYNTPWMKEAISRLYAHILLFFQKAVKWYNMSSSRRVVSSIVTPYRLSFQDTVDEIQKCTEYVDEVASTSSRAEVRGLSAAAEEHTAKLDELDRKLSEMQAAMAALPSAVARIEVAVSLVEASVARNEAILMGLKNLTTNNFDIAHDTMARICHLQQSQILDVLSPDRLPEDVLQACQSFARRRPSWRQPGADTSILLQRFSEWALMPGSAMFVIQAHPRAAIRAKDMLVEITTSLKVSNYPVFIHVSDPNANLGRSTLSAVLRSLAFQALRHDPTIISRDPLLGHMKAFQSEHSHSELVSLVCSVLAKIKHCFIVIDTEDIYRSAEQGLDQAQQTLESLDQIFHFATTSGTVVKMLIVNRGTPGNFAPLPCGTGRIVGTVGARLPASRLSKQRFASRVGAGFGRYGFNPRLTTA